MRLTFKYRMYPTDGQANSLDGQLREACRLDNAALQERRDAWRINHISLNHPITRSAIQIDTHNMIIGSILAFPHIFNIVIVKIKIKNKK